jgi:integrase
MHKFLDKRSPLPNLNHPPKGNRTTVEPIRDEKALARIKKLLAGNPRDFLLLTLGINNGPRVGDLLDIKVGQLRGLKVSEPLLVREGKTGKTNVLMLNKSGLKALEAYLKVSRPSDETLLFASRKGGGALTVGSVNALSKAWCRAIGLKGNYGSHSLRKTFGYPQRTRHGVGWELLAKKFNHASTAVTMRYLESATTTKSKNILLNEI